MKEKFEEMTAASSTGPSEDVPKNINSWTNCTMKVNGGHLEEHKIVITLLGYLYYIIYWNTKR